MMELLSDESVRIGKRSFFRNYDLSEILRALKDESEDGVDFWLRQPRINSDEFAYYLAELGYIYHIIDTVEEVLDLEVP